MTAASNDLIEVAGQQFYFEASTSKGLFDPAAHGLPGRAGTDASRPQVILIYQIVKARLVLEEIYANIDPGAQAPVIGGVTAEQIHNDEEPYPILFSHAYRGLGLPVAFSGGILLKTDFIGEHSDRMGFHPTWGAMKAHELTFHDGAVVKQRNISKLLADFRKHFIRAEAPPLKTETEKWGRENFDLDYDFFTHLESEELFEEDDHQIRWNKVIAIGLLFCLAGVIVKNFLPIRGNMALTAISALVILGGIALLNSGLLGLLSSRKEAHLK